MFNNRFSNDHTVYKSALEIDLRVREQERELARLNAEDKARLFDHPKRVTDPILIVLTSLTTLLR